MQRDVYDRFFGSLLEIIEQSDSQDVIDTFLHSSIRNKQLREAFENGDSIKKEKLIQKEELATQIAYYEDEVKIIGEYIQKQGDDQELRIKHLVAQSKLKDRTINPLEDVPTFNQDLPADSEDDNFDEHDDAKELLYPISLAGMKYFFERLTCKSRTLGKTKQMSLDKLRFLIQSFKDCIGQASFKINTMQKATQGMITFNHQDLVLLKKLSKRYLSSYEKRLI